MRSPVAVNTFSGVLCVAALVLAGGVPQAHAQAAPRASMAPVERGLGLYGGRSVAFRVMDGWAVVEGDVKIGRADALARALRDAGSELHPKGSTTGYPGDLWLRGASGVFEVPYVVTADPGGKVPQAVAAFNAAFAGVIQFVPRSTQPDYVDFSMNLPASTPVCTSFLGRIGGRQLIDGPSQCPLGALLHEMGHAIGLHHEQSRVDRDQYILVQIQNVAKSGRSQSDITTYNRKIVAPYDYGSIMHYDDFAFEANGEPTLVTIPQGIEIGQSRGFSDADVDTVRRLYGMAPTAVTVTSAPPGLAVIVDDARVITPQTYTWAIGSTHTIDVPAAPQTLATAPYVFGRWNVDVAGDQRARREIRVDPGPGAAGMPSTSPAVTVYTANFVKHFAFTLARGGDTAAAAAATSASVSPLPQPVPGLPGLYLRANQVVTLSAATTGAVAFGGWFGTNFVATDVGFGNASIRVFPSDSDGTDSMQAVAVGIQGPLVRLRGRGDDGSVDGHELKIDTTTILAPFTSAYSLLGGSTAHQVTAVTPQYRAASTTRYTFKDWDGSTANPISVNRQTAGQPSREITANFAAQHLVTADQANPCTGTVTVANPSLDDYYDHGRVIAMSVTPAAGWQFTGWSDDLTGTATSQSLAVNGEVYVTASFNLTAERFAVTGTSRSFAAAGDPGFDLTVYGSGFTPTSVVFVAGFSRPTTVIDGNRARVTLTAADLANAGELRVSVGNTGGAGCRILDVTGLQVHERGFTWPAAVQVVEFYNATLDHYFVTASTDEMAKLDDGTFKGWSRTGLAFKQFAADSPALALGIARAVCRFYGNPAAGLDSHFYSAFKEECDDVKRKFPTSWVFESSDVFQAVAPDRTTGSCQDGTVPVYRLFNGRTDANHRYTTDAAVRTQMMARGGTCPRATARWAWRCAPQRDQREPYPCNRAKAGNISFASARSASVT